MRRGTGLGGVDDDQRVGARRSADDGVQRRHVLPIGVVTQNGEELAAAHVLRLRACLGVDEGLGHVSQLRANGRESSAPSVVGERENAFVR